MHSGARVGLRCRRVEEAGRLRDGIKRLQETKLLVADDPLAGQMSIEDKTGRRGKPGTRTYAGKKR